jgi:hypothetical protein
LVGRASSRAARTVWLTTAREDARPTTLRQVRPSLRDLNHFATQPGVETPGYCRPSLRDKTAGAKPAELGNTRLWRVVCGVPPQTSYHYSIPPGRKLVGRGRWRDAIGCTRDACAPQNQFNRKRTAENTFPTARAAGVN